MQFVRHCSSLFVIVRHCSSSFVIVRRTIADEQRRGNVWGGPFWVQYLSEIMCACTKLIKMKLNQKSFLWGQGWHLHPSLCNVVNNPEVPPWSIRPPAFEKCISPLGKIFRKIAPPPRIQGGVTHYDAARIRFFLDMQFSLGARKCWTCNVYEIIETIND